MSGLVAQNPQIRRLRRLARRRRARHDEGLYLIEGPVLVQEALEQGTLFQAVYYEPHQEYELLIKELGACGIATYEVSAGVLSGITDSVNPRPIVGLAHIRASAVADVVTLARESKRPLLVLVDVRDPGNVGTILRAATASGVAGVVCCVGTVDPWAPKVARSAAGSLETMAIATGVSPNELLPLLASQGIPTLATVPDEGSFYFQISLVGSVAIVLGNEAHGLDSEVLSQVDSLVTIPMENNAESLNVAMAASVLCFEAQRQRLTSGATRDVASA
ncbi:MAG: RNA methyltransferase [Acidimicrobiia bacterium]